MDENRANIVACIAQPEEEECERWERRGSKRSEHSVDANAISALEDTIQQDGSRSITVVEVNR
jgi:hypothetical protein